MRMGRKAIHSKLRQVIKMIMEKFFFFFSRGGGGMLGIWDISLMVESHTCIPPCASP